LEGFLLSGGNIELAFVGLQVKVADIFVVFSELCLGDGECGLEFQVLPGVGGEVGEELFELADLGGVEARAAMIKKIRYWELSPKK
jgi:hypothetical protein